MEAILENIYIKINDYVNYLNWYFIAVFISLIFGLTKTKMLDWWKDLPFVPERIDKLLWLSGLVAMAVFLFFIPKESLDWSDIENVKHYLGSLLQSYIIVIVSHTLILNKVMNKLKR